MENERTYKILNNVGGGNIALGVLVLVTGIVTGILIIVNGGRLLKAGKNITF